MTRLLALAALALAALPAAAQINGPVSCANGAAALGGRTYACNGVDVMSVVPTCVPAAGQQTCRSGPLQAHRMNDVWGWTDPQTGREYALGGTYYGTAFVDVTDPAAPVVLGNLPTQTQAQQGSVWRDIKVYRNVAYVVSEASGHGIQVFDLTRLRGLAPDPTRTFSANTVYRGVGSVHNLVLNEATGFAYAVGFRPGSVQGLPAACNVPGFHAVSLADPLNPTFAGCFNDASIETGPRTPGYTHDAQCVTYTGPDATYAGRELCFAANEDVLTIFDVTDKANVRIVSTGNYPSFAYTHQGWLSPDQRYLLLNDELDERNNGATQRTMVFDVQDLDNPELSFQYQSGLTTIDHNLYTLGRYAYQSNYESGLRILDMAGLATGSMAEVAFFDTYPQSTTANFNGTWSNYPYFASGNVVVSDINNGLFVLRPTTLAVASEAAPDTRAGYALSFPSPNPAALASSLTLAVDAPQQVAAEVFDGLGRLVQTAFRGPGAPGTDVRIDLDAAALPSGVYVVRVAGETFVASRRLVVTR